MDRGFFSTERWLRNQAEKEHVFKSMKIKRPNIYRVVSQWSLRHFPEAAYNIYSFRVPWEILNSTNLIVNRIYSVDEFGTDLIQQAMRHLQRPLPEYIKFVETWSPFDELEKYFQFLSPTHTNADAESVESYYSNALNAFLQYATLSPYVKYIDRIDRKGLQVGKLISLVEDSM